MKRRLSTLHSYESLGFRIWAFCPNAVCPCTLKPYTLDEPNPEREPTCILCSPLSEVLRALWAHCIVGMQGLSAHTLKHQPYKR